MSQIALVIDMQPKLISVMSDKKVLENSVRFLQIMRELNINSVATEQYKKGLGESASEILDLISGKVLEKTEFSAFKTIKDEINGASEIFLLGIEGHICVYQTAIELAQNGYKITLIDDCIASRELANKQIAMSELRAKFNDQISIKSTEMVAFEILKDAKNEHFKAVSKLIK